MSLGKFLGQSVFIATVLVLAGCSGGGSAPASHNSIASAVQDLTVDAEGLTTVITFGNADGLAGATAANFQASAGQAAQSVSVNGTAVTVTWSARVTPSHTVQAVGLTGIPASFHGVTSTNTGAPTFTITSGTQNAGLGGDVLVVQFSGAHVIQSEAESLSNWTIMESSQSLDLTGSTVSLNPSAQTVTFTLGTLANLHASFTVSASGVHSVADVSVTSGPVNGTATGDSTPPTLVSAEQILSLDEYGRVIEFTFSKAMDPVSSLALSHYVVTLPDLATTVLQASETKLRVAFNNPIVPGVKTVTLMGLTDLHGNPLPDGPQTITQPAPVTNTFDGPVLGVTVPNALNDYLQVTTTQALEPNSAIDPTMWTLHVAGNLINMANQAFEYDFLAKTLTITLDFDMHTGNTFTIIANGVLEVDGQTFGQGFFGTAGGDASAPSVSLIAQNRTVDPSGKTLDATMNEAIDEVAAETLANWTISGAQSLQSATLLSGGQIVRLVYDSLVLPGSVTMSADHFQDLAGNTMSAPQIGITITTNDSVAPAASTAAAIAVEGANDDMFVVGFDDDMIESEVETAANWQIESPVGNVIDTTGTSVTYDGPSKTGTLTLANGVNLKRGDDFKASFITMRDLGGNTITATPITGLVQFETSLPLAHSIHRDGSQNDRVVVRFSEPCDQLTNLYDAFTNPYGTRYLLRDSGGTLLAFALAAAVQDNGLGVAVDFGIPVGATDTVDIMGPTDLAGNPLFPVLAMATVAEDLAIPSIDTAFTTFTSVSGENNDYITVKFDRPMSPWQLLKPVNYSANGSSSVDLATAEYSFDGIDTVTIKLKSNNSYDVLTGQPYNLGVNNVWSAQGTQRTTLDADIGIVAAGDATLPNVLIGNVRVDPLVADALVIEFTEAMSQLSATTAANYDYASGNLATLAQQLGPRNARATFAVTPAIGQNLSLSVKDMAGNDSGTITRAVAAADAQPPQVASISGSITPGWGGDTISVSFDEPVLPSNALVLSHYAVTTGSTALSLTGASAAYSSATNTVTLRLASGQEIDATQTLTVTVNGIADVSGNTMPAAVPVTGPVTGDTTAPFFKNAFVAWPLDITGKTVEVLFSEDVDSTYASVPGHWSCSGGQTVLGVTMLERNHARLDLNAPLAAAQTISMSGIDDLAHNTSGLISVDPVE